MKKEEALDLLRRGEASIWNEYRKRHPNWAPNFEGEDLSGLDFHPVNKEPFDLSHANLVAAKLPSIDRLLPFGSQVRLGSNSIFFNATDLTLNENVEHIQDLLQSIPKDMAEGGPLSGALISLATTIEGGFDLDLLVKFGAVFVTEDELRRRRASIPHQVFISYAWADEQVVLAIEQWLRLRGLTTTIDKRDFFAGAKIRNEIMRNMSEADVILIFHSERSKEKPWIEFEREFAADLEMDAKQSGQEPPRIIFVVIDDTRLPDATERNRLAIMAKGKLFEEVCQEIYDNILLIPRTSSDIDLEQFKDYKF
jgi:hypothetical protein